MRITFELLFMLKKTLIIGLIISLTPLSATAFSDVLSSSNNLESINFIEELGFFSGGKFNGEEPLSRGELFEYIARLNSLRSESSDSIDGVSSRLRPWVAKFRELGIRTRIGGEGFEEDKPVNKVTAFRMLMNFEGVFIPRNFDKEAFRTNLDEVPAEAYYSHIIAKAFDLGLLNLVEGEKYNPLSQFTREDLAVMLASMEKFKSKFAEANGELPRVVMVGEESSSISFLNAEQTAILEDVWRKVNIEYADRSDIEKEMLFYGMLEGMVDSLGDQFSVFQTPEVHDGFMQSLSDELEGIGASLIENEAGEVEIVSPLKESPAEKAGILPGDVIVLIDGIGTDTESLYDSIGRIKGPAGSSVALQIRRGESELTINIVRDKISLPAMTYEIGSDDVAILSLNSFGDAAVTDFEKFINEVDTSKLKGMILDLRNNPGGYVDAATEIADYFLAKGEEILEVKDANGTIDKVLASTDSTLEGIKTVILLNGGSASAAEILSLALSENGYATTMGQTSYGKGSVQQITNYVDNSALKLTIAKWMGPNGVSINHVGIVPDITVQLSAEDMSSGQDVVMNRALGEF